MTPIETHGVRITAFYDNTRTYWRCRIYDPAAKRIIARPRLYAANEREAWAQVRRIVDDGTLARLLGERGTVKAQAQRSPGIVETINWYIQTHSRVRGNSAKTLTNKTAILNRFQLYCARRRVGRFNQLSTAIIEAWQLELGEGHSQNTVRGYIRQVREFIMAAHEAGQVPELPNIRWTIPPRARSSKYQAKELQTIRAALEAARQLDAHFADALEWAVLTGWLPSDIAALRFDDIRTRIVAGHRLEVIDSQRVKTGRDIDYPLDAALQAIVDRRRAYGHTHVFTRANGKPWTSIALTKRLDYVSGKTGAVVRFRDIRVTALNMLANMGCPAHIHKELACHATIEMSLDYYTRADVGGMADWQARRTAALAAALRDDPQAADDPQRDPQASQ